MTCWLKLPLAPVILAGCITCGLAACATGPSGDPGTLAPGDDGGGVKCASGCGDDGGVTKDATSPVGTDSGSTGAKDSGALNHPDTGTGGDGAAGCTLPPAWSQGTAACDDCQTKNCCASIQACSNDSACAAIYVCQSNCYSGIGPDGGALDTSDGSTAPDICASDCLAAGTAAAQSLFNTQDTCVNTTFCAAACK